ncbi:TniQ family protein [Streptomyces sp. NPDC127063]|uniref:TniQ family protein n=1 Tax=Streptomyces sp. NPDC127063 TaxID=3347123 RepID=UPI003669BF2E
MGGVWRLAPLEGEMTQSFLSRLAARYGVRLRDLLGAVAEAGGLSNVMDRARPDSEVYLNREARDRVVQLCRVPGHHLGRALPAWAQEVPRQRYAVGPAAQFHVTPERVLPWGPACPECAARRIGQARGVRLYMQPQQRVCRRHGRWLMQVPGSAGLVVRVPGEEWKTAQRAHARLLRRSGWGADAFEVAQAVTRAWWRREWSREELWPARLQSMAPEGMGWEMWRVVAREMVTYPETVALAGLLADGCLRRCMVAEANGRVLFRLADLPVLIRTVADCMKRPWLVEQLGWETSGPLFACGFVHELRVLAQILGSRRGA